MTDTKTVRLVTPVARQTAATYLKSAPDGWVMTLAEPTRNSAINAALHAKLGEIATSMEWAGRKWDIDTWKRLLVAAWSRTQNEQPTLLPALDGQGVDVVWRRTSKMTQSEVRDLLGYIEAWHAEREAETC